MTELIVLSLCNFHIFFSLFVNYSKPIMSTFHDNDSRRFALKVTLCP